jgi:hypothetical protein
MNINEELKNAENNHNKAKILFEQSVSQMYILKEDLKEYSLFFCKYPDDLMLYYRISNYLYAAEQVRLKEFGYQLRILYYNFFACELNYYIPDKDNSDDKREFVPILVQPCQFQIKSYINKLILPNWSKIKICEKPKKIALLVLERLVKVLEKILKIISLKIKHSSNVKDDIYINIIKSKQEETTYIKDYNNRINFLKFNVYSKCLLYWATEESILNNIIKNIKTELKLL